MKKTELDEFFNQIFERVYFANAMSKVRIDAKDVNPASIMTVVNPESFRTNVVFGKNFAIELTESQRRRLKEIL